MAVKRKRRTYVETTHKERWRRKAKALKIAIYSEDGAMLHALHDIKKRLKPGQEIDEEKYKEMYKEIRQNPSG